MSLRLARRLAAAVPWLDPVADRVQPPLQELLARAPRIRNLLDGRRLGAPLHPALTDVTIGAWTTAVVLDAVEADGADGRRGAADAALAVGTLAALPTALTGLSDWSHLRGEQRRIGSLHATLNGAALALNLASLGFRASGHRSVGRLLTAAAFAATGLAAHLGGELAFGLGVRVNKAGEATGPKRFTRVLDESDLDRGEVRRVDLDGVPVLLSRVADGRICAIGATCSHMGGPLDEGTREGDTIVCPWHGSRFDLASGAVIESPAVFAQPTYETRVTAGKVSVRASTRPAAS